MLSILCFHIKLVHLQLGLPAAHLNVFDNEDGGGGGGDSGGGGGGGLSSPEELSAGGDDTEDDHNDVDHNTGGDIGVDVMYVKAVAQRTVGAVQVERIRPITLTFYPFSFKAHGFVSSTNSTACV